MNNFIKYPSIENHYNQKTIDYWRQHIQPDDIFYTQEKIHGANFSVHWKDGKLAYAKRSGFIGVDENFYNYQRMVERYKGRFEAIFKEFNETNVTEEPSCKTEMILYGELCGGCFPGVKIPGQNISAIQKGVYYSPDIEFVLYDIAIVFTNTFDELQDGVLATKEERVIAFANPKQLETLAKGHNIPYVPIMAEGTFDECLAFNNTFESNIYPQFMGTSGTFDVKENIAEGFVIKPVNRNIVDHLGARLIIKSKSPKWAEKVDEHETKAKKVESEVVLKVLDDLRSYLTDNRYSNLISKHGPEIQDFKNFQQLTRELNLDVIEDLERDYGGALETVSKPEYKEAKTLFWKDVTNFVKSKILGLTRSNPAV